MYYTVTITPQIADTDMQGHINFLAYSNWFDRVRTKFYKEFTPDLNFRPHGVVVLRTEVTFEKETYAQYDATIRTWVSMIGTKSFEVTQEVWQNGSRCAIGKTIFCAYNFEERKSEPIIDSYREVLERYAYDPQVE